MSYIFFTDDEFNEMVDELRQKDVELCEKFNKVIDKTVKGYINTLCGSSVLTREDAEDILQNVKLKFIRLVRKGFNFGEGQIGVFKFRSWVCRAAKCSFVDQVRKENKRLSHETDFYLSDNDEEGETEIQIADPNNDVDAFVERDTSRQRLKEALLFILDSETASYIALTWIAWNVHSLKYGTDRIESNPMIVEMFGRMTLREAFGLLMKEAEHLTWLNIPERLRYKLEDKLDRMTWDGRREGDVKLTEKYGEKELIKMISGWETQTIKKLMKAKEKGILD